MVFKKKSQLNEVEATNAFRRISKWHVAEICCLAAAFLISSTVCLCLSYVNYALYPDCILYSKWTTNCKVAKIIGLEPNSVWGQKTACYLTQYGQAAAAVAAFILCWFFVFFRPTKEAYLFKKKTAASKLILPSILICLIFTITIFVATVNLYRGVKTWCENLVENQECNLKSCSNVMEYTLRTSFHQSNPQGLNENRMQINFYAFLASAQVFSLIASFVWLANLILLVARCYLHLDFPSYFFSGTEITAKHQHSLQTETDSD